MEDWFYDQDYPPILDVHGAQLIKEYKQNEKIVITYHENVDTGSIIGSIDTVVSYLAK